MELFARGDPIDILVLDIRGVMQEGASRIHKIRNHATLQNCPILLVIDHGNHLKFFDSLKDEVSDFILPPFLGAVLEKRLLFCLERKIHEARESDLLFALSETRKYFELAIEGLETGFALFDSHQKLLLSNTKFRALYELDADIDSSKMSLKSFLHSNYENRIYGPLRRKGEHDEAVDTESLRHWLDLRLHQYTRSKSYVERFQDGRWIEVSNNATVDGGIVTLHKDITSHKNAEQHLEYLAWHDPLTGLVNRSLFEAKLKAIFSTYPNNQRQFAVLYLDLDEFKQVNDRWGHDFGDALLKVTAQHLQQVLREGDTVARIGGDEFAILLPNFDSPNDVEEVAQRIIKIFSKGFTYEGRSLSIGVSIGIVICPDSAEDLAACLRYADLAMYKAKRNGKSQYRFFKESDVMNSNELPR